MKGGVKVRGRSNILVGLFGGVFPLVLASATVGSGMVRAAWSAAWMAVLALMIVRAARMAVVASPSGLSVRNFGRDYWVPWDDVDSIEADKSDNVTGGVSTLVIRRTDGSELIGRGASSYSRRAVERWRDEVVAVQPPR